ncbi:MAG: carbohydrate-binding domain-containing protein [Agriterribacter sp.]
MNIRKYIVAVLVVSTCGYNALAQNNMTMRKDGSIIYQSKVSNVDSLKFASKKAQVHQPSTAFEIPTGAIDSITFENTATDKIYIIYNGAGNAATIINPFSESGVTITDSLGFVTVNSTYTSAGLEYNILGSSERGNLNFTSAQNATLVLTNIALTNPVGPAFTFTGATTNTLYLTGSTTNTLSDNAASTVNGTIFSSGALLINGSGTLSINAYKKHGITASSTLEITNGTINILTANGDATHSEGFTMNNGTLTISNATGDGVDAGAASIVINNGNISVTSSADDAKAIKSDAAITINDGNITLNVSGNQSKAISSSASITINGGTIDLTCSGAAVLEASGSGYDASYASAIKADVDIIVNGGAITATLPSSNDGGKGFSADGNIAINNGTITVTTAGAGTTYTNETGTTDSYTPACIKADGNISILAGNVTCSSSGTGGKGIAADGTITLGVLNAADANLNLNVTTTGERFYVSGTGQNADYANPKAIKSEGNFTVNSGIITVSCTQTNEGGEGLESKDTMFIKGGQITANTYDDCINAANHIALSGGTHYLKARGNDGLDCNGTLTISGGFTISNGARSPEEGFDCDMNTFKMTGGTIVGTGGATSDITSSVSTQRTLKINNNTAGSTLCIKRTSDSEVILMMQLPSYTTSGGGGGGNSMVVLFSDPALTNGTYTVQRGGTITGGTNVNGYYTGATMTGGTSSSFTISSVYTTVP